MNKGNPNPLLDDTLSDEQWFHQERDRPRPKEQQSVLADLDLAYRLLGGDVHWEAKPQRHKGNRRLKTKGKLSERGEKLPYLKYLDGRLEAQARKAIARLLLSDAPLPGLRIQLAALFDPELEVIRRDHAVERKITFGRPSRQSPLYRRRLTMALAVGEEIAAGNSLTAGCGKVAGRYAVDENTVDNAWKKFRQVMALRFAAPRSLQAPPMPKK